MNKAWGMVSTVLPQSVKQKVSIFGKDYQVSRTKNPKWHKSTILRIRAFAPSDL